MENIKKEIKLSSNIAIQKKYGLDGINQSTYTSNIYDEAQTVAKLRSSFEILSNTIGKTMGPYGSTILLEQQEDYLLITKDGKDVFDHIRFNDNVAHIVWTIVKRAIGSQARGVGDGTTSAVVVANKLYQNFIDALSDKNNPLSKLSPKDILDINKYIVAKLKEGIQKRAIKVSDNYDEIAEIAAVSFNNDRKVGEFIRDIYRKTGSEGYISTYIKPHNHLEHEVEFVKGFELEGASPTSREFLTFADAENEKVVYNDKPLVFMVDGIMSAPLINTFLNIYIPKYTLAPKGQKPLDILFIASDYDSKVKEFLLSIRKRMATPYQQNQGMEIGSFIAIDYSTMSPEKKLLFSDLSVALGTKIFNPQKETHVDILKNPDVYFGVADRIEVSPFSTKIMVPEDSYFKKNDKQYVLDARDKLLIDIRNSIDDLERSSTMDIEEERGIEVLKRRLNRLTQYSSAVIDPGGSSLDVRASDERLFEDAILSSKNAIRYGYISGGFLTASRIINENNFIDEVVKGIKQHFPWLSNIGVDVYTLVDEFLKALDNSYLEVYRKVLQNADVLSDDDIENIIHTCIDQNKFYNIKERKMIHESENTIINPVNLDLEILETISNIMMLLINTQIVISRGSNRTEEGQKYI